MRSPAAASAATRDATSRTRATTPIAGPAGCAPSACAAASITSDSRSSWQ
nr:hypothetical protein [Microbacterium testaceum]